MSLDQIDKALAGAGAKSAMNKDTPVGTTVTGTVVEAALQQVRDYMTGEPKHWDDGNPQQQVVVKIQTSMREDAEDDGIRGVYIKTWGAQRDAFHEAVRNAGCTKASEALQPGGEFSITFTGTRPSKAGSDEKVYSYAIKPAPAAGLDAALNTPAPTAAQPAAFTPPPAAPAQAAPAPAQQPAPAAAAPAPAGGQDPAALAKQLITLGLPDEQIAATTGLDAAVITAIRAAA